VETLSSNMHARAATRTGFEANVTTSPAAGHAANFGYVPSIAFAAFCLVGTGGLFTPEVLHARDAKGYPFPDVRLIEARPGRRSERQQSAAEHLNRIKAVFRTSMTELAAIFAVSRQAIYNWQAGQPVSEDNLRKVVALRDAAELVVSFGLEAGADRPLPGGKTLAEQVVGGTSPAMAVASLGALLRQDQKEREALALAGLSRLGRASVDLSGVGVPKLDEGA
jgi:hypothetical protein